MAQLVPNRLLFRFAFPIRYHASVRITGNLRDWTDAYLVPDLSGVDGAESFGRIWMAWNEKGLYIACRVTGRKSAFQCNPKQFWKGDNLRLCTDMRDTRENKRASRYCQQFYFLPTGGGLDGKQPVAGSARIHRAAEHAPLAPEELLEVAGQRTKQTYALEAHIPAGVLAGFDPEEHRRIGVFTMLEDSELGQQYLTVGDDLYWYIDPSTWATGEMTK